MTESGNLAVTFCKLLPEAFSTVIYFLCLRRSFGIKISFLPFRYCAVTERLLFKISSSVPCTTTSPPCSPAPGPMSTIKSAVLIASSSCSTTKMVLSRSRSWVKLSSNRSLSRWCKPIEGSSSTYITPVKPLPIWEARRIRWDSPPLSVPAVRDMVKYSSPTWERNDSLATTSFKIGAAIVARLPLSFVCKLSACVSALAMERFTISAIFKPSTVTARAFLFKRLPEHAGQGWALRY